MPAMNYFDSNRTKTVIFNLSSTVYTRHLVGVPFTSFRNFELILNYLFLNIDSTEQFLRKNILKKVGVHSFIISSANKMAERSLSNIISNT